MTPQPRRLLVVCGAIPAALTAMLSLARPAALANLDYGTYDVMARAIPVRSPSEQVVIVDVDERSLAAVGQWPWKRDQMAALITRLRLLGASVVALDVIFSEAEQHQGPGRHPDATLADAVAHGGTKGKVVLGYAFRFDEGAHQSTPCARHPIGLVLVEGAGEVVRPPLFRATGAVCNLAGLSQAAAASGFLNAAPDSDGILRRVPLLLEFGGRTYPGLALAAVATALDARSATLRVVNDHSSDFSLSDTSTNLSSPPRHAPLDGAGNLLLRYRGPKHTLQYVPAVDVLEGHTRPAAFKDKLVFVGTTALGTREVVATPLDTLFSGVEVQATVADNLMQHDFVYRPAYGRSLETGALVALCVASAVAIGRWGIAGGALSASGMIAVAWVGAIWVMSTFGAVLLPVYPTVGVIATVAGMTGAVVTLERRRADRAGQDKARSQSLMVETLLSLTEIRDAGTGQHSRRIQLYARLLSDELAQHARFRRFLTPERVELLSTLAMLHDIGKVGIPDAILNKEGPLTKEEMEEMRRHPVYGRDVIAKAERAVGVADDPVLALAKQIVYTHHEKWDGTGYPEGLRGTDIPIPGRLIALVDVYDAVVTHRPYRSAMSHQEAVALISRGSGSHFDPAVVEAFARVSREFERLSKGNVCDAA